LHIFTYLRASLSHARDNKVDGDVLEALLDKFEFLDKSGTNQLDIGIDVPSADQVARNLAQRGGTRSDGQEMDMELELLLTRMVDSTQQRELEEGRRKPRQATIMGRNN